MGGRRASWIAILVVCVSSSATQAQLRGIGAPALGSPSLGSGLSLGGAPSLGGSFGSPDLTVPLPSATPSLGDSTTAPLGGGVGNVAVPSIGLPQRTLDSVTNSLSGSVGRATDRALSGTNQANRTAARRSGVPPVGEQRYMPNEVLVAMPTNSRQRADEIGSRHQLTLLDAQPIGLLGMNYHRWRIADGRSVSDVIRALEADGAVRAAQPNYRFALAQDPSAPVPESADQQYALDKLHVSQAHRVATGKGVLVAVIDSEIDTAHPEIAPAVADRFDAVSTASHPDSHGTGMAGVIVAHSQMTGIAPAARILAIRAFSGDNGKSEATTLSILRGLDWAIERGARIINMSFAGPFDPDVAQALAAARKKGAVLIAAAGNAGPKSPPLYPAADKNVIAVTATDTQNHLLRVANRGPYISLAAPGVDILVPTPGQGYTLTTGTSVAAAQVSGLAALLLQLRPKLSPDEVRNIVQSTSLDLGPKGRDDQFGYGLADAERAVMSLIPVAAASSGARNPEPAALFSYRWPDAFRPARD